MLKSEINGASQYIMMKGKNTKQQNVMMHFVLLVNVGRMSAELVLGRIKIALKYSLKSKLIYSIF